MIIKETKGEHLEAEMCNKREWNDGPWSCGRSDEGKRVRKTWNACWYLLPVY